MEGRGWWYFGRSLTTRASTIPHLLTVGPGSPEYNFSLTISLRSKRTSVDLYLKEGP